MLSSDNAKRITQVINKLVQDVLEAPAETKNQMIETSVTRFFNKECVIAFLNAFEAHRTRVRECPELAYAGDPPRDASARPARYEPLEITFSEIRLSDAAAKDELVAQLITLSDQRNETEMRTLIENFYKERAVSRLQETIHVYNQLVKRIPSPIPRTWAEAFPDDPADSDE